MLKRTLQITILLFLTSTLCTAVTVDFYSDATIGTGDVYDTVNIYDSLDVPPVQTTVTMTGGNISYGNIYDTANLDIYGGDLSFLYVNNNATATIFDIDYIATIKLSNNSQLHLYDAGNFTNVQIFDNAELHVYGYDFSYDPSTTGTREIYGTWESGQSFQIALRQPSNYDPYTQVILHEIPEPVTLLLFAGLIPLIRTKRNNKPKMPAV